MPTKKNSKKRARDTGDSSGPPKKRMKKVKNNAGSLRRSARNHSKPKPYWKVGDEENENDDDSDTTYLPATRRTRATTNHNKNRKSVPKAKSKRVKPKNKTKTNKKASDHKTENEESSEMSDHSATESVDTDDNNNNNNDKNRNHNHDDTASNSAELEPQPKIQMMPKQRRRNSDIDLLSPHKPHTIRDLPRQIDAMMSSQQNHSKAVQSLCANGRSADHISKCLKSIKNVLRESESLHKTQTDITRRIASEFTDLSKNGEMQKKELNKNLEKSNQKYQALQRMFEESMENIYSKVETIGQNTGENDIDANNEYKVLYETSIKKIKMLNEDLMSVKQEMKLKNEQRLKEEKQRESDWMEMEHNKRKEMEGLRSKYLMEVDQLKVELKCRNNEFHEYKQKIGEQQVINANNQSLLIDTLKRENKALLTELAMYQQEQGTMTPNSRVHTPVNTNYNDYRKHIEDSPLNTRIQNELISISNTKQLENKIKNLNEEIASYKKQLFAKKELIKEFQELLEKSHAQQKQLLQERERDMKIMNVYQILTSTKIEQEKAIVNVDPAGENQEEESVQRKQEQYKCRTVHKDNESMLEYYLSLEATDENALCDYNLISSHNLSKPLNASLVSCITFYTKDAPLFLKGLIQEIFIKKQP